MLNPLKNLEQIIQDEISVLDKGKISIREKFALSSTLQSLLENLLSFPIHELDRGFMNNLYCLLKKNRLYHNFTLWFIAIDYIHCKEPAQRNALFIKLEGKLKKIHARAFDEAGMGQLPRYISEGKIIRNLYRSGDQDLINLLTRYLPTPPSSLFKADRGDIPIEIISRECKSRHVVRDLLVGKSADDIKQLEKSVLAVQRRFRRLKKQREDIVRYKRIYKKNFYKDLSDKEVMQMIRNANIPYMPKCRAELARRIYKAAFLVPDIPTIRHLTSANNIDYILDESLYGRRNLTQHYISFRPAALMDCDRENGDSNAICFAPQEIDSTALKTDTIEIEYDMSKFLQDRFESKNPCVFYKQKDLEYLLEKVRTVKAGDIPISFTHTTSLRCTPRFHVAFKLLDGPDADLKIYRDCLGYALVPYVHMISNDIKRMSAVQSLQFFRFIDNLKDLNGKANTEIIELIYSYIAKLSDEQLIEFLTQLRNAMTDTAEFNFYGAHKLNPELISTITYYPNGQVADPENYTIDMQELINALQAGDQSKLREAKANIPVIFNSSTFVNYLNSQITATASKELLFEYHKACTSKPLYAKALTEPDIATTVLFK